MDFDIEDLYAFIEEKYKVWKRISINELVQEELRFRDPQTGRFISREKAQELIDKGIKPKVIRIYRAKTDWESLGIRKGRFISREQYATLKEINAEENRIRGFMRTHGILDRNEGVRRYYETLDKVEQLRKMGVSTEVIDRYFSP